MKFRILVFLGLSSLLLTACGGEDTICDCIRVSDKLTDKYEKVMLNPPTSADKKELKELIKEKKAKCKEFEKMGGPEMMKRKATCS